MVFPQFDGAFGVSWLDDMPTPWARASAEAVLQAPFATESNGAFGSDNRLRFDTWVTSEVSSHDSA